MNAICRSHVQNEFFKDQLKFLSHVIDRDRVRAYPAKVQAMLDRPPPSNVSQMCQFARMVNQLVKLFHIICPLTEILSSKQVWQPGPSQEEAFKAIKRTLTEPTMLALYNPSVTTKISADTSSYGIGAVLMQ